MFAFASHSRLRGALPPWWFAASLRCTPLQRLRASRYSGGVAFLLHQEGWGLHPTSGHQLSALTKRCHSSPSMFYWFRVNGSHPLVTSCRLCSATCSTCSARVRTSHRTRANVSSLRLANSDCTLGSRIGNGETSPSRELVSRRGGSLLPNSPTVSSMPGMAS